MKHSTDSLFLAASLGAACLAAACSSDSGSGAGDTAAEPVAELDVATLSAFTGVYDLTGNWNGSPADAAFLVIRSPDDAGTSEVALYDIDDAMGNCSFRPSIGEAVVDRFTATPQVFLNGLFEFDSAVLSRAGNGALQIEFTDVNDIDGDGSRSNRVTYQAQVVAQMESDLPAEC